MHRGETIAIALEQGQMLEEYRIDDILGKGGFAITYLATDTLLDKQIAIKELLPDGIATRVKGNTVVAQTPSQEGDFRWAVDSFLQEAKVLASFEHPNIVSVLRLFETNGTAYIVMPLIQGKTIKEILLERGKLPYETVHGIIHALLNGLSVVHQAGVLHRDIKPENIFLTDQGMPILIDFGAARQQVSGKSQNITSIITPGYAPIEQYSTDARYQGAWSDIYALAAVAYHMTTGKRPAAASDRNDAMRNQSPDPLPLLSSLSPAGYPPQFLAALDQALLMSESQRPADINTWLSMLGDPPQTSAINTIAGSTQHYTPVALPKKSKKKPLIIASLIGLIFLMICGGAFLTWKALSNKPEPKPTVAAEKQPEEKTDTSPEINIQEVARYANAFLSSYTDGFWSGPDAWYLSDTRITDEFAIAMHRNLKGVNIASFERDPITNRQTLTGQSIYAGDITAKDQKAFVKLDGSNDSSLQLIMVRQDGKWLIDGRQGGKYQLNAASDISPRMDERELLLAARKRKSNLMRIDYENPGELRGVLIQEPIRTHIGTSRQQPFLKFSNRYLDIGLSAEEANKQGIKIDRYYAKIPIFYPNAVPNGFKTITPAIGRQVVLNGRIVKGSDLPDTHPLGLYVDNITKQLNITPPPIVTGNWLFPNSHKRLLNDNELSRLSKDELWRARNEIYARRGLIFTSARGRALTQSIGSAYRPVSKDQDSISNSMNAFEKANVDKIKSHEAKNSSSAKPVTPTYQGATLKSRLHPVVSTTPSNVYLGKFGNANAIYSIQWLPGKMLRGSIFKYNEGKELHIYGSNYQDGVIQLEIWQNGSLLSNASMRKATNSSTVTWSGYTKGSSQTAMQYSRALARYESDAFTSHYLGTVGTSTIDITLNWRSDGTVSGNYRSRSSGKTYQLAGDNTVSGFLYLDEFTSGNLSARVLLVKKTVNGSIQWRGSLFNTDGRVKNISFTKK